ncbi:response regulator transcription factor [Halioxenophilus sp. WMMB6]|uniref:response regulator transcription factor n=1 Tax=Halioxenophilus sp. WMMB6 TaxID=3073815 RepID=UPI00295E8A0F|nr:LuxR C-terminal-related transcriptional regulator [Halioxenophilus sp. WMMB6]
MSLHQRKFRYEAAALNPFEWGTIATHTGTLQDALGEIEERVNSLVSTQSVVIKSVPWQRNVDGLQLHDIAGCMGGALTHDEWEQMLLRDINPRYSASLKFLVEGRVPAFIYETSSFFNHFDKNEKALARKCFSQGLHGFLCMQTCSNSENAYLMIVSAEASRGAIEQFEKTHAPKLQLAYSHFCEGLQIRNLVEANKTKPILSPRERDCLACLSAGLTTKQIGRQLNLSDATVNEYITSAKRKLGAKTRSQACARAVQIAGPF